MSGWKDDWNKEIEAAAHRHRLRKVAGGVIGLGVGLVIGIGLYLLLQAVGIGAQP